MWPNLRSVIAQRWRSIWSSRQNFSSWRGSKGEYGFDFDAFVERNFNKAQLKRRGIGFFSGLLLAAITVGHPAGRLAVEWEEENREFERSMRE